MTDDRTERLRAKRDVLAGAIAAMNKGKDDRSVQWMSEAPMAVEAIPTGATPVDIALGVGGLPRGRVVELFGPEGSGKSTLALSVCREAQRLGGVVLYIDAEHALDPTYVEAIGLNLDDVVLAQPASGEEGFKIAEELMKTGAVDVVVFDSVAAMVPEAELSGDIGDMKVARTAAMMSQALRRLTHTVKQSNALVIFVNQLRINVGQMYGNPETTPGGKALRYYSSVRLEIRSPNSKRDEERQTCKVKVVKNKVASPFKTAEFDIVYGVGIDNLSALVESAIATGVWTMRGAFLSDTATGETIAQGRPKARIALEEDPEYAEAVSVKVAGVLAGEPVVPDVPVVTETADADQAVVPYPKDLPGVRPHPTSSSLPGSETTVMSFSPIPIQNASTRNPRKAPVT